MDILADKVAVITGAGSGIGAALAIALDKEGMQLVLVDIEKPKLEGVGKQLSGSPLLCEVDVSNAEAMMDLAEEVFQKFKNVHILFNNAGVVGPMAPMWELEDSDWDWVFKVNVKGTANGIRAFVPRMLAQNDASHIVNTASEASFVARAFVGVYHASKHAVLALTETLAQELAFMEEKIRVSVLCPGAVKTEVMRADRNRPKELAKSVDKNVTGDKLLQVYHNSLEHGMAAADVATVVIDGIRANRFYLFSHPEVATLPEQRANLVKADGYPEFDPILAKLLKR